MSRWSIEDGTAPSFVLLFLLPLTANYQHVENLTRIHQNIQTHYSSVLCGLAHKTEEVFDQLLPVSNWKMERRLAFSLIRQLIQLPIKSLNMWSPEAFSRSDSCGDRVLFRGWHAVGPVSHTHIFPEVCGASEDVSPLFLFLRRLQSAGQHKCGSFHLWCSFSLTDFYVLDLASLSQEVFGVSWRWWKPSATKLQTWTAHS